ncbi:hypothetical protein [Massilibacteroides sp.]|uniref:hypothetical protein n=1 Tax=Massilibacteroides sp. TaxID=2034766 RepID=UPI00262E72F6|nr:hypothetical protein [Massilibacteroides sp.]MDD4515473.1 hypothetical protein [Massilibacteroides sp.]
MKEIREYRSMAYTAYGASVIPPIKDKKAYFIGYVGTQGDKVIEAIEVYTDLLNNLPLHPERIDNIKNYMREVTLSSRPNFREISTSLSAWNLRGYTEDPAKTNLEKINQLTFEDIIKFHSENIKGKAIGIAVIGDPKQIDAKTLEKYGKVIRLSPNKLFSNEK